MKTREFNDLPKIERIRCFASAPRASAATITKLEDGDFRTYWISRLCGRNVRASGGGRYLFDSREEAVKNARRFRDLARRALQKIGGRVMPAPEKIRHLRQYVGDTQRSAAERVGVARRTWQDWERGVARMPVSAWELYRIRVLTAGTDSV